MNLRILILGILIISLLVFGCEEKLSKPDPIHPSSTSTKPQEIFPHPLQFEHWDIVIQHSLEESCIKAMGDVRIGQVLSQEIKRVLVWWLKVPREIFKNDRLEILGERIDTIDGPALKPIALWWHSRVFGARSAFWFNPKDDSFFRWIEDNGAWVESALLHSPLKEYEQITSRLIDGRGHAGTDYKAPTGTPVFAPYEGVVQRRNWNTRINGLCLEAIDRRGLLVRFLHLNTVKPEWTPGRRFKQGELLAEVGDTGRSTAPHLHYELRRSGRPIDPFKIEDTVKKQLADEDQVRLESYIGTLNQWRAQSQPTQIKIVP